MLALEGFRSVQVLGTCVTRTQSRPLFPFLSTGTLERKGSGGEGRGERAKVPGPFFPFLGSRLPYKPL